MRTESFQKAGDFERFSEATLLMQAKFWDTITLDEKKKKKTESLGHVIISLLNHIKIC